MRPLFQEVIVAYPFAQFQKSRCHMEDIYIIFPWILHEFVYVNWFGHNSPTKLSIFLKKSKTLKIALFIKAPKAYFLEYFFSKCFHSKRYSDFSMKRTANGHKYPKLSMKKAEPIYLYQLFRCSNLKIGLILFRKF